MAFKLDGVTIHLDIPFTGRHGRKYPANWLRLSTLEQKKAAGLIEVEDTGDKI
tara:strand:+ start:330 stop:488 length:159 start_codon:yes stop_codon:yes gene_type:complete